MTGSTRLFPTGTTTTRSNAPRSGCRPTRFTRSTKAWDCTPLSAGFASALEDGELAVVQGVGYPNPSRSHFQSLAVWHTALPDQPAEASGWLNRCLAAHAPGPRRRCPGVTREHLGTSSSPRRSGSHCPLPDWPRPAPPTPGAQKRPGRRRAAGGAGSRKLPSCGR